MKFSREGENDMINKRNIILAISGEAGVGKTTTVNEMEKILNELGIEVEMKCVGKENRPMILEHYRKYLKEEYPELTQTEIEKKTIEDAHSDPKFSMIIRKSLDDIIDTETTRWGNEINKSYTPNRWYIGDGRLVWKFVPSAISIKLVASDEAKGERAFNDPTRGFKSKDEAAKACKDRSEKERQRYLKRYNIDLADLSHYDIVLDTSNLTSKEAAIKLIHEVIEVIKRKESERKLLVDGEVSEER